MSAVSADVEEVTEIDIKKGRAFVVGDIHGCLMELEALLSYFSKAIKLTKKDFVIFIGDYIDRGPDSCGVINALLEFAKKSSAQVYFLKGNHEEMILNYLDLGGSGGDVYLINGGAETFASYELSAKPSVEEALAAIPEHHITFYQTLERYVISEDYIFVHAGLNPLRDLRHQFDEDIFWIRDEFIHNLHYFKKTIIFGHTPFEDVMFHLPYKIGIDTGVVYGNALTAIELRDEQVIQVPRGTEDIEEFTFKQKGGFWPTLG